MKWNISFHIWSDHSWQYIPGVYLVVSFLYLQHIFFAGLLLCGPSDRRSFQLHSEFWNDLIDLALWIKTFIARLFVKLVISAIESWQLFKKSAAAHTDVPVGLDFGSLWNIRTPPWRTVHDWAQFFLWKQYCQRRFDRYHVVASFITLISHKDLSLPYFFPVLRYLGLVKDSSFLQIWNLKMGINNGMVLEAKQEPANFRVFLHLLMYFSYPTILIFA